MPLTTVGRGLGATLLGAAIAIAAAAAASAQELKFQGPLKILVGFAAGGQSDILARILADRLKERIGRPVVVENKTGAAGRLAVEMVKASPPDGSVLVLANTAQMSVAPSIYKDLPYDPLRDFAAVGKVVDFQIALATGRQSGAQDFKALLEWLKANPDKGTSGNPGSGSLPHLYGYELAAAIGVELRPVPYRGGAPIIPALVQGELAIGWAGVADFIEQHRAGQLRIVAVTGQARSPQLKEVPTFAELGYPAVSGNGWIGLFGAAGTPAEIVALYSRETGAILADPAVRERLEGFGFIVAATGPAELKAQVEGDLTRWRPVIEKAGIRP